MHFSALQNIKLILQSLAVVGGLALAATTAQAYTAQDLLNKSQTDRHWFYFGGYMTLSHVTALSDKEKGDCIANWYFGNSSENALQVDAMLKKFPEQTPSSLLIAIAQQQCGEIER